MIARLRQDPRYLTLGETAVLVVAAPCLLFPAFRPRLTAVALAALAVVWLLRWAVRGEPWPVTPLNGPLLLLVLMIPVGAWASPFPDLTLPKLTGLILGLAALRAAAWWGAVPRSPSWVLAAFALLGLAIVVAGVLGVSWPNKIPLLERLGQRLAGPAGGGQAPINPNELGGTLALYLPVAVACLAYGLAARRRLLAALALAAALTALAVLVLTQSRGAWLGAAFGLAVLAAGWGQRSPRHGVRMLAFGLPPLAVAALGAGVTIYVSSGRMAQALSAGNLDPSSTTFSLAGRMAIWLRAIAAVQDFPITGCGLGAFRGIVNRLYPLFLSAGDVDVAHAHNIFLQTALDLGLPGLVAYLSLLWTAGAAAWGLARDRTGLGRALALGLLGGLVALHVFGMTDAIALGAKPGLAFWLALGLIAAARPEPQAAPRTAGH